MNFDINYLRAGEKEWAEIFYGTYLSKSHIPNFFVFSKGGRYGLGRGPKILSCASPRNQFSKIFNLMPREIKNQNYFKKNLQVWVLEQFSFTPFDKKVNFWLNNYLDLHHWQGVWNLPHKLHLYLIWITFIVLIDEMMEVLKGTIKSANILLLVLDGNQVCIAGGLFNKPSFLCYHIILWY